MSAMGFRARARARARSGLGLVLEVEQVVGLSRARLSRAKATCARLRKAMYGAGGRACGL